MRIPVISTILLGFCVTSAYAAEVELKSQKEKLSYTIGFDLGSNFKEQAIEVDPDILEQGITDGMKGDERLLSQQEMDATLESFQQDLIERRAEQFTELAEVNEKEGVDFLENNKGKEGWKVLPSGLQYKVVNEGKSVGTKPAADDTVTVEYTGTLIDGTVFDSSEGAAVTFNLAQIIPGWSEALKLMSEGSTWEVVIPSDLAYGAQGFGVIGPNQTLIFEIQLIAVGQDDEAG
ncbi:MAG: FKBP-type peptidyl-prolyl cis-trans isomerase [Gammaproteobacteria bacterium]